MFIFTKFKPTKKVKKRTGSKEHATSILSEHCGLY